MKTIEEKVDRLLKSLGETLPIEETQAEEEDARSEDEKLMNGPQMDDQAISQDEIDKLLASFD